MLMPPVEPALWCPATLSLLLKLPFRRSAGPLVSLTGVVGPAPLLSPPAPLLLDVAEVLLLTLLRRFVAVTPLAILPRSSSSSSSRRRFSDGRSGGL